MKKETLSDWGEFRLLREIVLPAFGSEGLQVPLGDDCAYIPLSETHRNDSLVITTDASPRPLVWQLGCESYWCWGWYSVIINVSDLTAAGAKPLAFTSSVDAPEELEVEQFKEFFAGMAAACRTFSIPNAGGNIRAASHFGCHGTAIGVAVGPSLITRQGCKPGDAVVAIGESGRFISAYLNAQRLGFDNISEAEQKRLLQPYPQLREMEILHQAGLLTAASDNSDGVLGALWNIAERSECSIQLDFDESVLSDAVKSTANTEQLNPWNLFFFWGDWQVIACVKPDRMNQLEELATAHDIRYTVLGKVVNGPPLLCGIKNGDCRRLNVLRNENFRPASFKKGLSDHVRKMLQGPLFSNHSANVSP